MLVSSLRVISSVLHSLSYLDHVYDCLIHIKNGDQYSSDDQGWRNDWKNDEYEYFF